MPFYHVRISVEGQRHDEVKTDMSEDTLELQYLGPYRSGEPITVNGKVIPIESLTRIRIGMSEDSSSAIVTRLKAEDRASQFVMLGGPDYAWRAAAKATDVTDQFITGPPGSGKEANSLLAQIDDGDSGEGPGISRSSTVNDNKSVFVVAGRDSMARQLSKPFFGP